ncbi:meiotic cohesin complex subunit Rec8 [Rhizophagus clarus]|uniref:Meiotic cohesin complex subunit Rec8 n=1 Tax=Rhizophagus clarus TaxID=94130 RepID=A0A8H3L951_9GLOM|nr:meiotic cohesin complex subunit Rec8 [Rhizophagus clarus]
MFYSKEILTRKSGGFGIIWLAATLGSRSSFRKLSKKEVNSVNLVRACEYVTTPPEPLALRLTSNLMIGITRVYHQQYHFYYSDVNGVWHNLQRALIEMRRESIDMIIPQARYEAITLNDDPFFEIELKIPMHDILMSPRIDVNFAQFPPFSDEGASNKSRHSLITLPEIETGFTASSGEFSNVDGFGLDLDDDVLMIDDSGIRIDFDAEGCLHEFVTQPESQQDAAINVMDDIIRRVRDEHNAGLEEGRKKKRRKINNITNDEELQEMEIDNEVGIQSMNINVDIEAQDMRNNEEILPSEEQDDANKENVPDEQPEQKRRNRRKLRVMFDEETELTNEQILEMRRRVKDDLDDAEIAAREKMRALKNKMQLDNILYTPGKSFLAPQLTSLWQQHYAPMLYDENVKKRRIQSLASVINLNEHNDSENNIDVEGSNIPHGIRESSIKSDEPERLRKEGSQQNSAIISGMESSGFDKYPEIDHYFDQNSSVGGSIDMNIDLLGQHRSGGRQRLVSMGFNAPFIDFSDERMLDDDDNILPTFGDLPLFDNSSQARIGQSTATVVNSEQEAMNFFESIKTIMNDADVSIATFQDIMETQHVRRVDVARDFYYILALATRNLIRVNQAQSYGNIMIQVRNE